jgi:hypothetical protein
MDEELNGKAIAKAMRTDLKARVEYAKKHGWSATSISLTIEAMEALIQYVEKLEGDVDWLRDTNQALVKKVDQEEKNALYWEGQVTERVAQVKELNTEVARLRHYGSMASRLTELQHHVKMLGSLLDLYIEG